MGTLYQRKYGVETTVNFELYELDGTDLETGASYAVGDVKIMKDEGAEANTTNGFTDEGTGYSLVLTAAEMTAKRVAIYLVDQSGPKIWLDKAVFIETYGDPSALHGSVLDEALAGYSVADSVGLALKNLLKLNKNRLRITGNQLILYNDDGTTPLYTWDLKNSAGVAASQDIYDKVPV